jgi:hypothetical protein
MGFLGDAFTSLVFGAIQSFFVDLLDEAVQIVGTILVEIVSTAQQVLDYPLVIQGILYAQGLAVAILAAKVAAEALRNYILYSNGDADADPGGLLLSTAKAAAVIGSVPWFVRWLYRLGTEIALEVSGPGGISPSDPTYGNFMQSVSTLPLVLILVAMVLIALIYIQTFIRAAHLGMLAVIGPIVAIGLVGSNSSNVFNLWVRELVVVCFSQALQVFMLMAALYALGSIMTGNTVTALLMFVGWLWSTMKAPSVLKQMLYSSGLDSVAGGAAQSAGTMVLVRKMMTRGV